MRLYILCSSNKMELAVQRFTLSCAGYCVATYILVGVVWEGAQD